MLIRSHDLISIFCDSVSSTFFEQNLLWKNYHTFTAQEMHIFDGHTSSKFWQENFFHEVVNIKRASDVVFWGEKP
jgi:hypothetical protein